MVVAQGDVLWADLPPPVGSGPGYRRPVVVIQGNSFNRSRLRTTVCVVLTSHLGRATSPGNVLLPAEATGLSKDSVTNVTQIMTVDSSLLFEHVGKLSPRYVDSILLGIDTLFDR